MRSFTLMLWLSLAGRAALAQDAGAEDSDQSEGGDPDTDPGEDGAGGDTQGPGDPENPEADDPADDPDPGFNPLGPPYGPSDGPVIDLSTAREAPSLTEAQHDFLKPRRSELPQNPYAQTDFTAYSLEWGEFKVGLASISAGVLPRIQLTTVPTFWALNIPNGNIKFDALRAGPVDIAVTGDLGQLRVGDGFRVTKADVGALASVIVLDPWSIHAGLSYGTIKMLGEPDLSALSPLIDPLNRFGLDTYYSLLQGQLDANEIGFDFASSTLSGRFATDYRFNRRDSVILQANAVMWRNVDYGVTINGERMAEPFNPQLLPELFGLQEFFTEGERPFGASYVVSASWQWAWKHVDLRLGLGWSAIQPQWLLQAVELDYRFGGKTRTEERRIRKGWRQDRESIDRPDEAVPIDN